MPGRASKNRLFTFPAFFTVFVILNILAVVLALRWFWGVLAEYETSTPVNAIKGVMAALEEDPVAFLAQHSKFEPGEFSTREQFEEYLAEKLGEERAFHYTADGSEDANVLVYTLLNGQKVIAKAQRVRRSGKGEHGFDRWELAELSGLYRYLPAREILAPPGAEVRVNGVLLTGSHVSGESNALPGFGALPQTMAPPALTRYQVNGLLAEPVIEAVGPQGQVCGVNAAGTQTVVSVPADDGQIAQWDPLVREIASLYARFITKDAEIGELNGLLLPGGALAKQLSSFYNGWYIEHDSYEIANMNSSGYQVYGEGFFSCHIAFDYTIIKGSRRYDYPSSYTLYYVYSNGKWLVANLSVN